MLKITRQNDSRVVKSILHRVADIPGGVAVKASLLGGSVLYEGTPLAVGTNGLHEVIKTATVAENYTSGGASLKVKKGSHFVAGDKLSDGAYTDFAVIASIDKSNAAYDLLTFTADTLSLNLTAGVVVVECNGVINDAYTHDGVVYGAHATDTVTEIKVDKGHNFEVGDYIAGTGADPMTGKQITAINRGYDLYDVITVGAQIGKALADNEELICVTEANGATEKTFTVKTVSQKAVAVAIVGSNEDVSTSENLNVSAWVIAVARETDQTRLNAALKANLKQINYIV